MDEARGNAIRRRHHRRRPITVVGALLVLLAVQGWQLAEAIRLEHVEVPSVVAVGEPAHLNCEIDLEQDELYSVKWYKDSEEFYEWKPKRSSPVQVYHVEGVYVDREKSHKQAVVLRSVSPLTAGFFRCEVSGERPKFHSVSGGAPMSVVILPKRKPDIFGGYLNAPDRAQEQRQEGSAFPPLVQQADADETIELNCTTDASRPGAQIRWFVNDAPVRPGLVQQSAVVRASSGLEASYSVLRLRTRDHFTRPGPAKVTCEAVIHYAAERASPSTHSTSASHHNGNEPQQHEPLDAGPATVSVHADAGRANHQRRVASEQTDLVFQSRFVASPETSQFLTQRKEIIINVNSASGLICPRLILLFGLFVSYCIR